VNVKVTDEGVLIPKELLRGAEEVEIRQEGDQVIIIPQIIGGSHSEDDPIFKLETNPVECDAPDASENLDRYLYAADE
jgi:virulence-associated protein VagC